MTEPRFAKETDLCAAFIAALPKGWTAYAEWGGWDILLVGPGGVQVGIEAKLALNATVLLQARERFGQFTVTAAGPDFRAVLVPQYATARMEEIARAMGVTVIRMRGTNTRGWQSGVPFYPYLPDPAQDYSVNDIWHDCWPWKRITLPEVVPDCAAGTPAPLRLTSWKLNAIKIAILLDRRPVTRADFKALGIDMGRWTQMKWLVRGPERGTWVWGEYHPNFRREHPKNFDEIAALYDRWAPPEIAPPSVQEQLL